MQNLIEQLEETVKQLDVIVKERRKSLLPDQYVHNAACGLRGVIENLTYHVNAEVARNAATSQPDANAPEVKAVPAQPQDQAK
jgi:hypothetical protein